MAPDPPVATLHGGPLDGRQVAEAEDDIYEYQAEVDGIWSMLRYERTDDGDFEYAGIKSVVDIANEAIQHEEIEEDPPVDLETLSVSEALEFLQGDNERRIAELFEATSGEVDLANSFDVTFLKIAVEHLLHNAGTKVHEAAHLAYEDERSKLMDEVQTKYEKFAEQREQALRQAQLGVQQGPPQMMPPAHQGRITMPNRRVRRGGG